jgi:hypothetical protein
MRPTLSLALCASLFSLAAVTIASAQTEPVPADIESFAARYVAAINAKDAASLRALWAPESRACVTPQNKDFYDFMTGAQFREAIPASYMALLVPINENNLKALADTVRFPVKPSQELHIDSQQGEDVSSIVLWLIEENGRWLADFPCPTDQATKQFHEDAPARAQRDARFKALATGIKEPLRSELIGLLRNHETARASTRYQQATGQDIQTSMLVIEALKQSVANGQ